MNKFLILTLCLPLLVGVLAAQEPTTEVPPLQSPPQVVIVPAPGVENLNRPALSVPGCQLPETLTARPQETAGEKPAAQKQAPNQELQPPTEFEQMVEDVFGHPLPLFGARLFAQPPATFAPIDNAPVPADYVIGPGDELAIRIWGPVELDERITVDRNGEVYIARVGAVSVAGVRYSQLAGHLRQAVERSFRNFQLSVALGRLRTIDIFVVGQARHPGRYSVSSLSTLVNALFACGGPAAQGTLRHVQLKREDRLVTELDLYDLLLRGDKSKDAPLLPGDVVYIPAVGPLVALGGSVNQPAIYEVNGQSTVAELLETGGGLSTMADSSRILLERIAEHRTRTVREVTAAERSLPLQDGDVVRVASIVPSHEHVVTLRGNVANPGRYPWKPGLRISDLIPDRRSLLTRNYWLAESRLVDGRATEYDARRETLPATKPGCEPGGQCAPPERTEIRLIAPQVNWDYAVIQRLDPVDLSARLIPFHLGRAVLEGSQTDNLELQDGDIVVIFSQADVMVPQARQSRFVRLEGEVRSPGEYRIELNETLRAVVRRAGGLTGDAYLYGSEFTRRSAQLQQQEWLAQLARLMETELAEKSAGESSRPEDAGSQAVRSEARRALIEQIRSTHANGRMVLNLRPDDNSMDALPDLLLEDGDRLPVPPRPTR